MYDAKKELPHFERDPEHPTSYEDIKGAILDAADRKPVFVRDMCYYVADYVQGDHNFVRRTKNTFLIRTSEKSIPSYYRLDQDVTLEEIGLEAQHPSQLPRQTLGLQPGSGHKFLGPDVQHAVHCRALRGNPLGTRANGSMRIHNIIRQPDDAVS